MKRKRRPKSTGTIINPEDGCDPSEINGKFMGTDRWLASEGRG